ncbi:MAG: hypothetical protein LCH85_08310 [Chloroflexi bacterium]|nr:hypothetical protein [Chloroflexota bacterium]
MSKIIIRVEYVQPLVIDNKIDDNVRVAMECEFQNGNVSHSLNEVISGIQQQLGKANQARVPQNAIPRENPDSGL